MDEQCFVHYLGSIQYANSPVFGIVDVTFSSMQISHPRYGVVSTKGPVLDLPVHQEHCSIEDLDSYAKGQSKPIAIDLFCGAGGLSLGLQMAGFAVVLGVDKREQAMRTHAAHFPGASICRDLSNPETVEEICRALSEVQVDLIAGGPPCQPFSQAAFSKVRHLQEHHGRGDDLRRDLWQSYMQIVRSVRPKAVLIENVPEMGFGRDGHVLRQLVQRLELEGYSVSTRIVCAWPYGVPQYRQRLIIVGLRGDRRFEWPVGTASPDRFLEEAISDLPAVEGGDKTSTRHYKGTTHHTQAYFRNGVPEDQGDVIHDHFTRGVRKDDLEAFKLMTHGTKYSDLPAELKRYRDDIFVDKYKRLAAHDLCRTITAHIAQDGYWYIHPQQHRTLTVREAARVQTFPDWFRFHGYPANAFRQIGEAVPPLLGKALGEAVLSSLSGEQHGHSPSTEEVASRLTSWLHRLPLDTYFAPWRASRNLWLVLLGEIFLRRSTERARRYYWPKISTRWPTPDAYLADVSRSELLAELEGDEPRIAKLASALLSNPTGKLEKAVNLLGDSSLHREALALTGQSERRPSTTGIKRVAERVWKQSKSHIDGRGAEELLVARLVGADPTGEAYLAALEVADQFCRPKVPHCSFCPLSDHCLTSLKTSEDPKSFEEDLFGSAVKIGGEKAEYA